MVASLFAGRLQFFVVEELGQLVLDGVETRLLVELVLELQSFDTEVGEYKITLIFLNIFLSSLILIIF